MSEYYKINGEKYEGPDAVLEWATDMQNPNKKIIKQEMVGQYFISTVWLGIDYRFGKGAPLIFETMVFDRSNNKTKWRDEDVARYSTIEEAHEGHERMVAKYKRIISANDELIFLE